MQKAKSGSLELSEITIPARHRVALGDVEALARSIERVGLLQPPVVLPNGRLVAGLRRIEAVKVLGWSSIPVTVAANLGDALSLLRAERDENTERKDFTPSEAVAIADELEPLEREAAKQRQGQHPERHPEKFVGGSGKAADKVAAAVGMSAPTLAKARAVVATGDEKLIKEMDTTGKVDRAHKRLKKGKKGKSKAKSTNRSVETLKALLKPPLGAAYFARVVKRAAGEGRNLVDFTAYALMTYIDTVAQHEKLKTIPEVMAKKPEPIEAKAVSAATVPVSQPPPEARPNG